MSGTYNSNATVMQIGDAVAQDPKLKGELWARYMDRASQGHNAFEKFTSAADRRSGKNGGVRSIFGTKRDLKAGGGDTVNFSVIGPPGGPGAMGNQELTGRTSSPLMKTYGIRVGWHRDAVELTKDLYEFLAAGGDLRSALGDMLAKKMGLLRQNHMMMRLKLRATAYNTFRPNNRTSRDAIVATDTVSLGLANAARARLRTIGGAPIKHKTTDTGSPVDGYLQFFSDTAMLNIRNDDGYQNALANGGTRGDGNENFTGELVQWSGMPWYEFPSIDEKWDDYIGTPLQPKALLRVAFGVASASADCLLKSSATNVLSRYFQFFPGFDYKFELDQTAAPDAGKYYAWIINPDNSLGFIEYTGSGNDGNKITVDKILSHNGAGTSTKGATTVGQLVAKGSGDWTGVGGNLPTGWNYTNQFVNGAVIIPANAKGTQIGEGFVFGAMAAFFANGRIDMEAIEQDRDFKFAKGHGFETIFGTDVAKDPLGNACGYLLAQTAIEHEGYPTPSIP